MTTIVVPLDGSPLAEQVLPWARALAALTGAKLHLMTAVPEPRGEPGYTPIASLYSHQHEPDKATPREIARVWDALYSQAEGYLNEQAKAMRVMGLPATVEVCREAPADAILAAAVGQQAAFIVLSTHGRSGFSRWALGSVTDKVLHAAPMPVLLVRSSPDAPAQEVRFRRILVPLDGSTLARQALPLAADLAQRAGAAVTLVQAILPTVDVLTGTPLTGLPPVQLDGVYQALHAQAHHELDEAAERLRAQGLQVNTIIETSPAADLIIAVAQRCQADLVIMATHGRSGFSRWALGSVADKVLRALRTPLLLVRASNEA
jgi:nucleotide-binding universal stress UspA family protein